MRQREMLEEGLVLVRSGDAHELPLGRVLKWRPKPRWVLQGSSSWSSRWSNWTLGVGQRPERVDVEASVE